MVVELKKGKIKPEYSEQVNFYCIKIIWMLKMQSETRNRLGNMETTFCASIDVASI